MRKTIKVGLAALAIALLSACGGADDPAGSSGNEANSGNQERVERQESTPAAVPEPTRPQRLDGLLTPTAEPAENPAQETGRENAGMDKDQSGAGVGPGENTMSEDPGNLIPEEPRFNDEVLLQDIYARMDLDQFGLDPNEPIGTHKITIMDLDMVKNHPYLHLIPDLENYVRTNTGIEEVRYSPWQEDWITPPELRFNFGYYVSSEARPDISSARGPIIYFIHHPWFEPVFSDSTVRFRNSLNADISWGGTYQHEAGPYWFGENSLRGVLANTVEKLMEEAMLPDAEPFPRLWWREAKTEGGMVDYYPYFEDRDWTLGEFIRTTDSSIMDGRGSFKRKGMSYGESFDGSKTPRVDWEIIHPELPIIRVTAHARHKLPLIQNGVNPDERTWVYPDGTRFGSTNRELATTYSVSFVVAFQNRWASFQDPNRWIIRFREELEPYRALPHALDPELPYPNYWDDTDYMHHSIIGAVVMTVHDSAVLQPGTYSRVPRVTKWEAPGHILTDEQTETVEYQGKTFLRTWPNIRHPSPGFPLPGHVTVSPYFGPGSETWRDAGMEGFDW